MKPPSSAHSRLRMSGECSVPLCFLGAVAWSRCLARLLFQSAYQLWCIEMQAGCSGTGPARKAIIMSAYGWAGSLTRARRLSSKAGEAAVPEKA